MKYHALFVILKKHQNLKFLLLQTVGGTIGITVPLGTVSLRERSGSVIECLTRDRRAAGLSLTGVTALWSLSKTHLA